MSATTRFRPLSAGLLAALLAFGGGLSPATGLASGGPAGDAGSGEAGIDAPLPSAAIASDRVIVRWEDGGEALAKDELLRSAALSRALGSRVEFVRTGAHGTTIYRLATPLGSRATTTVATLRRVEGVDSVQPDRIMRHADMPDDPYADLLWSLLTPADGGGAYGLDPTTVWPTTTGTGAVVAVVDTGITDHLDLAGQVLPGYDMISDPMVAGDDDDGRDANPADEGDWDAYDSSSWHGTHVAGTIAALADNGLGVFGAAPGAKIVPVRVLGHEGGYESDVMDGLAWAGGVAVAEAPANANPARVINLSLGGDGTCSEYSQAAIDDARAAGAVIVVAAGNDDDEAEYATPANCAGVLAVAATDSAGHRAYFSNYGDNVGIAAPGVDILSTMNAGRTVPAPNPSGSVYSTYSGTSMAAPHVSAAAALLAAAFPDLPGDSIARLLRESATPFPAAAAGEAEPCAVVGCGAGIVNAPAAFELLQSGPPVLGSVALPAWVTGGDDVTVDTTAVSGPGIMAASAEIDGGAPVPMTASDGSFGGHSEEVELTFAASAVEGTHTVCITATNTSGLDSTPACATFGVDSTLPAGGAIHASGTSVVAGQPVEISKSFTDQTSGIASVGLTWDGSPITASTADGQLGSTQEMALGIAGGGATSIAAGIGQTCVLTPGGGVACWGYNGSGQIGDGSTVDRSVPRLVKIGGPAISVSGSAYHGCAVRSDHHLVCWGTDSGGQFGTHSITGAPPMEIAGITDAVSVAAGLGFSCILARDATVTCLGTFLSSDYRVPPYEADTSSLTDVVAITAGYYAACAMKGDGTVWCWGAGPLGELGNGKTLSSPVPVAVSGVRDAVAISAGDEFACAIRSDRSVWCWGANVSGELGRLPTPAELRGDIPPFAPVPSQVPGVTGVTALSTGFGHACATGADGTWCWGGNESGQIGTGETTRGETPTQLAVGSVGGVSAGLGSTCVIGAGGGVRCWGAGTAGMLGNGKLYWDSPEGYELTPQDVAGFDGSATVGDHALCLTAADLAGNETAPTCTTVTVTATTPSAPTAVTARAGNGQVEVDWQPPVTDGGSPITGYTVTSPLVAGACTVAASERTCSFPGLANGIVHDLTVMAETGSGPGGPASVSAIPATGSVLRVRLATGRLDVAHAGTPVQLALGTSVPRSTPGLAYRFARRTASGAVAGHATSGAWGLVSAPIGTRVTYEGWATVGGAATPVFGNVQKTVTATQETSSAVHYSRAWTKRVTKSALGGTLRSTATKGRSVSFRVTGTSVAWVGAVGPERGRARVYVDGRVRATVDLYARTTSLGQVVWTTDLGPGSHTVKIVVLGTHNARSRGSRVDLDAFLRMN